MFTFFTKSGTAYKVHNGRISRFAVHTKTQRPNAYHLPEDSPVSSRNGGDPAILDNVPFAWDVKPEVGRQAVFTVKGMSECVTTSRVTRIVR